MFNPPTPNTCLPHPREGQKFCRITGITKFSDISLILAQPYYAAQTAKLSVQISATLSVHKLTCPSGTNVNSKKQKHCIPYSSKLQHRVCQWLLSSSNSSSLAGTLSRTATTSISCTLLLWFIVTYTHFIKDICCVKWYVCMFWVLAMINELLMFYISYFTGLFMILLLVSARLNFFRVPWVIHHSQH